ncbi:MAG: hypothetical protein IPN61_06440 [Bacteroidetes bacterium]|nr:hypothetical protein [Bacteroidota bacterium]
MPLGEHETHPYLNYWRNLTSIDTFDSLLLGSYPIYCISHSVPIEQTGVMKRQNWNLDALRQWFYGSRANKTENLIQSIFPEGQGSLETILTQNNFLVSDVVNSCQRLNYSALDKDLIKIELNLGVLDLLQLKNMKHIYFTSLKGGLPFSLFQKILSEEYTESVITYTAIGNSGNLLLNIDSREYYLSFLDSPSPTAERFKNSNGWKRHIKVFPNSTFPSYLLEQWFQLIRKKNLEYDGTNPLN